MYDKQMLLLYMFNLYQARFASPGTLMAFYSSENIAASLSNENSKCIWI